MYLAIITLPLLGSIASGLFGRKIGVTGAQLITSSLVILTTLLAIAAYFEAGFNSIPVSIQLFTWIDSESLNVFWGFHFDSLTVNCVSAFINEWILAVLVEIQLYKMIIYNKIYSWKAIANKIVMFNKNLFKTSIKKNNYSTKQYVKEDKDYFSKENFIQWFVGFTDAEGNFMINILWKKDKITISSFTFMFKITLHKNDESVLRYIQKKLGNIRIYKNECIFNVTDKEGINQLICIFDKHNLNTTKYLDYLDFKKAFNLYNNRDKNKTAEMVKDEILKLKQKMNIKRINFDRPTEIVINKNLLLGFIEGDGSFFLKRDNIIPIFSLQLSAIQLPVIIKIKEFLENNLGFDFYSLYKLKNSSNILVTMLKARNNSKASVSLTIKNIRILNNYFIPFLEEMVFLSKKGLDFNDFKIICKAIYNGVHRIDDMKSLILKLSYTMNNFRLSTHTKPVEILSKYEKEKLILTTPTVEYLSDGRQIDIVTKKVIPQQVSCVYEICKPSGEVIIENTLVEVASVIGIDPDTLSRHLEVSYLKKRQFVELKNYKVRRIPVFS